MGELSKQSSARLISAFTRLELFVVVACAVVLGLVALPLMGRSHSAAAEAVCMNNLHNLGRALLIYSDQNHGTVPEEGDVSLTIFNSGNSDAWYNLAVQPEYPAMTNLYAAKNYPRPGDASVYSCPTASVPNQPSVAWAFFAYGENFFLCVNKSSRRAGASQVQLSLIPQPAKTVLMGEPAPDATNPSDSGTAPSYVAIRHNGMAVFTMCDGSVRALTSDQFRHPGDTTSAATEWFVNGVDLSGGLTAWPYYWWPTSTTLR